MKTGAVQTYRGWVWLTAATLFSTVAMEVVQVGPHYEPRPTESQKTVYHTANVTGGAAAAAVAALGKTPANGLGSRAGFLLSPPQLRLAYVLLGGALGYFLPAMYGVLSYEEAVRRSQQQQVGGNEPPQAPK